MEKRMKKRLCYVYLFLCILFTTGCSVKGTKIVFGEPKVNKPEYIFQVNDTTCHVVQAKLFLANYRNLYGKAYGIDLWQNDYEAEQLEGYVKEITLSELSRMLCMNLLAEQMQISLDEEQMKLVEQAAVEYYGSLTAKEREYLGVSEADVKDAYASYALAKGLFALLTEGIDEEVSDDEARVIRVMQIFVPDQETAEVVREKLDNGEDFKALAGVYNREDEIECCVARDDYPPEVENIAFNLDNGAVSEMISCEEGYYFIKCVNKLEETLTTENKEHIRDKRRKAIFDREYEAFLENATFTLNEENWEQLRAKDMYDISTDSFFEVYEKYF